MIKRSKLSLVVVLALLATMSAGLTANAQGDDGLTEEEQALLDRLTHAVEISQADNYDTFVTDNTEAMFLSMSGEFGGQTINAEFDSNLTTTTYHINSDPENVRAELSLEYSELTQEGDVITYSILAEVRLVDDTLYVLAVREADDDSILEPMPDGWIVFESEDDWPALEELDLADFLDDDETDPLENAATIFGEASAVTLESGELDDGTPVDAITITFLGEGLAAAMREIGEIEEDIADLYEQADPESGFEMGILLDENDQVLYVEMVGTLTWAELDLSTIIPEVPPGMVFISLALDVNMSRTISNINEPLEPVAAPEM